MITAAVAAVLQLCGCSHTMRSPPVAVTALLVTCGALDERRLVGTDASALSAFVGARGGTVGATL
jgi:hypothetical protein